jgi:hypothetical protein
MKNKDKNRSVVEMNPGKMPTILSVGVSFCEETKLYQAVTLQTRGGIVISSETSNPDVKQAALDCAYQIFLERIVAHGI